jgi:hypothetical protein
LLVVVTLVCCHTDLFSQKKAKKTEVTDEAPAAVAVQAEPQARWG